MSGADNTSVEVPTGVALTYKDAEDSALLHQLSLTPVILQPALIWLSALQKVGVFYLCNCSVLCLLQTPVHNHAASGKFLQK